MGEGGGPGTGWGSVGWVLGVRVGDRIPSCLEDLLWEPDSPKDRGDVGKHELAGGHWHGRVGEGDGDANDGEGLFPFWWPVHAEPSSVGELLRE